MSPDWHSDEHAEPGVPAMTPSQRIKVAVVGGGSTYTPELADGIARLSEQLDVEELALTDPAAERLAVVSGVSQRILARHGYRGRVTSTTNADEALADASVVLIQLRVGGQAARAVDEAFPLQCGCVGQESTGPGGSQRPCGRCRSSETSPTGYRGSPPRTPGLSISPTRWASSPGPCWTPVTE